MSEKSREITGSLAFVFPGQGSQSVGMLGEVAERYPQVRETFQEAGDALEQDLWQLSREGPAEALARTEVTQPLMLAGGVALWRVWRKISRQWPAAMAGHSLGEYSALVAAEAITFSDAVRIVAERARLMQEAVAPGEGAMAAILGLDDEIVEAICREVSEQQVVSPANYNSPGQLVIAGDSAAVERAMHACRDAGARRAVKLPVSVPSHCALMAPAAKGLGRALEDIEIRPPSVPVLHNVDMKPRTQAAAIRKALVEQLSAPVRWTGTMRRMTGSHGISLLAECGPGKVLTGLGRRIDKAANWVALDAPSGPEELARAVA